jgi:hypothetical protein
VPEQVVAADGDDGITRSHRREKRIRRSIGRCQRIAVGRAAVALSRVEKACDAQPPQDRSCAAGVVS